MTTCLQWLPLASHHCGATPTRPYIQGGLCDDHKPGPLPEDLPNDEPQRPAGHGTGLDGPVCPERVRPQFPDIGGPFRTRMCVRCGRITSRLDLDGVGWCGGVLAGQDAKPVRHLTLVGAA